MSAHTFGTCRCNNKIKGSEHPVNLRLLNGVLKLSLVLLLTGPRATTDVMAQSCPPAPESYTYDYSPGDLIVREGLVVSATGALALGVESSVALYEPIEGPPVVFHVK